MKQWTLALSLALALTLTACGSPAAEPPQKELPQEKPSQAEGAGETMIVLPKADPEARAAFGKVLWDAYLTGILPDDTELDWTSPEGAAENDFALYDVDGDGQEELILIWTNACTAGNRLDVFGYANGAVYTELAIFPLETFYDNGVVVEKWSHNHGMAANTGFWPYFLHTYDAETDTYQNIFMVDAWNQELSHRYEVDSAPFPTSIDADGDGMVYCLAPTDRNDSLYSQDYLVDGPEYEAWRSSYLDGAQPLDITSHTQKLTEDNIADLGCPKPDVSIPEPVG